MAKQNLKNQMFSRQRNPPSPMRQVMALIRTGTKEVSGPLDPPGVDQDAIITKRTELTITVPASSSPLDILISSIAGTIPGGTTAFPRFRVHKVSIWAADAATNEGRIAAYFPGNATFPGNDNASFSDYGTFGQRRPQLHLSPTVATRQQWNETANASTDPFIILQSSSTVASSCILQFTLELRSESVIF